jgi:hypothetical protein
MGRGILLWLLGIPIPVIILIAMVLSLVIGAFIASAAAALGGRLRDEV